MNGELDVIVPVHNEGRNVAPLLAAFARDVHTPMRMLIAYDRDDDDTLPVVAAASVPFDVVLVRNRGRGVHAAVVTAFQESSAPFVLVWPADDDYNTGRVDAMVQRGRQGNDIVCASRFMSGGRMVGAPRLKGWIVRSSAAVLHLIARLPTHDPSNGLRLFSRRVLREIPIESSLGFTYSIELLVKCHRLRWPIAEMPFEWQERKAGRSRFRILRWLPAYFVWFRYAFATTFLRRGPETLRVAVAEDGPVAPPARLSALLRCVECPDRPPLVRAETGADVLLRCPRGHEYPVRGGIARMLRGELQGALGGRVAADPVVEAKRRTAASFGYEWSHFSALRPQWERNFRGYMTPHDPAFFRGKTVLDAGSGAGRHAFHAAKDGADVVAIDIGDAIEVTARNTRELGRVMPVQADLCDLPFADRSFDFVYSLGVLHHLPDPTVALRELVRVVRPGGEVHVYVYWRHESGVRRALLSLVTSARRVTTRLPYALMRALAYPIAAVGYALFVIPSRLLSRIPGARPLARSFPLAGYADYPFIVCVNDQFDRFTAPLERRYSANELREWLSGAGLIDIHMSAHYGWVAGGTRTRDAVASAP